MRPTILWEGVAHIYCAPRTQNNYSNIYIFLEFQPMTLIFYDCTILLLNQDTIGFWCRWELNPQILYLTLKDFCGLANWNSQLSKIGISLHTITRIACIKALMIDITKLDNFYWLVHRVFSRKQWQLCDLGMCYIG